MSFLLCYSMAEFHHEFQAATLYYTNTECPLRDTNYFQWTVMFFKRCLLQYMAQKTLMLLFKLIMSIECDFLLSSGTDIQKCWWTRQYSSYFAIILEGNTKGRWCYFNKPSTLSNQIQLVVVSSICIINFEMSIQPLSCLVRH